MIFSSWPFAVFFLVVFGVYWSLPNRRGRHLFLLAASYFFYMSWNPWLISLIVASTVLDYGIGRGLQVGENDRRRKLLLVCSVVGNLGILATFKYADFFILSLRELLQSCGVHANLSTLSIILPVGISFFTFQTMSYTIDIYRRKIEAERSFLDFALYVAFFPQLVAGPIVKARDFLPQLREKKHFEWSRIEAGSVLFLIGLTKKVLIADQLATIVDPVFADPTQYVTRDLWLAMFCYGGQIYCDFSGYTDMAIAVACVLGFDLRPNFASPYLAISLTDFWHRWHISLSTWLRDYLYIPLGGSRFGRLFTYRNLLITMLLGGLWHGASWTFVVWGLIHGVALIFSKLVETTRESISRFERWGRAAFGWVVTLLIVHIAWVFFRCQPISLAGTGEPEPTSASLARAGYFVKHLFVQAQVEQPAWLMNKLPVMLLLALMGALQIYDEWVRRDRPRLWLPAPVAGVGYAVWIIALMIFCSEKTSPFIYFQF